MGDIRSTQNVSIWDEDTSNTVNVDSDGDLNSKAKIWDGTNEVAVVLFDGKYRLAVDSITQGASSGVAGEDKNFHTENTYAANEVKELWNYVVPSGKTVYIHGMGASSNKVGASKSKVDLIKRQAGPVDIDQSGFFFDAAHQRIYAKAIKFEFGDTIVLEVANGGGNNNEIEVSINAVEVDA